MEKLDKFGKFYSNSLGGKFVISTILILAITLSTVSFYNLRKETNLLTEHLLGKAKMLGSFVSLVSPDAILSYDAFTLDKYMEEITSQEDVVYGIIVTPKGINLTLYLDNSSPYIRKYRKKTILETVSAVNQDPDIISLRFPIVHDKTTLGVIIIGLTQKKVQSRSRMALIQNIVINISIILFLGFSIYIIFKNKALKPISSLISSSREVAQGNLNEVATIYTDDELGTLTRSFNEMTSALKRSYAEKDDALQILKETNRNLEAATKAKSSFLANMSHEIRTPLTAIIGFGELLNDPETTDREKHSAVNTIVQSGRHLLHIINDILDLSKIEAEKLDIQPEECSLFDILNDVESLISMQAHDKQLDFGINYIYPLPAVIHTDPLRIKQILINLCINAIKFTREGSIYINIFFDKHNAKLCMDVIDTGIGMSDDQVEYIFNSFTQADSSTTRQYGGTGLGLYLSKSLANMLGGDISVKSSKEKGSVFSLSISVGDVSPEDFVNSADHRPKAKISKESEEVSQDITIHADVLLAEDNVDNQQLITVYLRRAGINVTIVDNGLDAVEAIDDSFDLVLMDLQMPVMDGIEALHKIREKGYKKPVIAVTANAMKQDREACFLHGFTDFIPKPINRNELYLKLYKYIYTRNETPEKTMKEQDMTPIRSSLLDDEPELEYIVNNFITRLPGIQEEIHTLLTDRDWTSLHRVIHSLKGSGGGVGFQQLTDISKKIEASIKNSRYQSIDSMVAELDALCERIYLGKPASDD